MKKMAIKRELKPQAISANQQQLENPYAFFSISRENILPGIIISLYVSLILILIYFVYDFFTLCYGVASDEEEVAFSEFLAAC